MANKPNNPSLWSKAKSLAKEKFDVYPSAYANGWAAKWYKSHGGTWSKEAEYGMEVPGLRKYQTAGTTQADPNAEKRKRMYDHAMEEYQFYMENPASWSEDPEMHTPDGKFNLCLDCIRVDWSNPDDIMDAYRLIEEGYSIGTHHNAEAFNSGLKALNLPPPVYNSKPVVKTAAPQKAMGGIHYGTFAPPMFAAGGMPCYECGGMYAEGGATDCPPGSVPDGNGNCVEDLSTPPTPESSYFQFYQDMLTKPNMTEELARKSLKARRQCKPGDECWEEKKTFIENVTTPALPADPFTGMERLYTNLSDADYAKLPEHLRVQGQGSNGLRNKAAYGWKDKDGTVYYEQGVPGTPGYQGKFSGAIDRSKYHFVDELADGQPSKEYGGSFEDYEQYAEGGGIPERYKNMGFTKVGVKKESTRPGKKWMVLAKKGDQYKVVHGGYDGMKDYTQHGSEDRRERFWDRMGGRDSAKAKDPFSPLYWHKRFGTWAEGGELDMYDNGGPYDSMIQEGDQTLNVTSKRTLNNLENNGWNRGLAVTNSLVDPRSPIHFLPDKGFGSGLKAIAGLAAGLSGATLGYEKLFSNTKTDNYLYNQDTKEAGKRDDVLKARWDKANPTPAIPATTPPAVTKPLSNMTPTGGSGMGAVLEDPNSPKNMYEFERGGYLPRYQYAGSVDFRTWFSQNAQRPDVLSIMGNRAALEELWKKETGQTQQTQTTAQPAGPLKTAVGPTANNDGNDAAGWFKPATPQWQQDFQYTQRGDNAGFVAANNALIGLGMTNQVLGQKQLQKQYNQQMMNIGNTDSMYNAVNPSNPYGNYTTNVGIGPNFALVRQTAAQDFSDANLARYGGMKKYKQGGSYMVSDKELMEILANGGDVEFL